jgi:hypothetical protein
MMIDPLQLDCFLDGLRLFPSLVFGMTVSVSDGASLVMLRGRHVVIETALVRHDECWVADETRSHIDKREYPRGIDTAQVALLQKFLISRVITATLTLEESSLHRFQLLRLWLLGIVVVEGVATAD